MEILNILKSKEATLIDVREQGEFLMGSIQDAINIPLSTFGFNFDRIRDISGPKVLFCRSGARSGQATSFLKQQGIDVINGGPWQNVAKFVN